MEKQPKKKKDKNSIGKSLRMQILAWGMIVGILMLFGGTFAWYSIKAREAESKPAEVMKPYYLVLLNPSETDVLQLSVGSLMPGRTKQVVFCVSNKNNEENDQMNMGGSDFDYTMELIHTDNLALNYSIYELESVAEGTEGSIVVEDKVTVDGTEETQTTYWKKKSATALTGTDVSTQRHDQVGLTGTEINRGTYLSYEKDAAGAQLHLTSGDSGYDSQFFLLEIAWDENEVNNFEKYEKETDMIYILVKALQPEPEKKTTTP